MKKSLLKLVDSTISSYIDVKIESLLKLPKGWDGYDNSIPFDSKYIPLLKKIWDTVKDIDLITTPQMFPGSDGSIQLEWHQIKYLLEIDITASGRDGKGEVDIFYVIRGNDEHMEFQIPYEISSGGEITINTKKLRNLILLMAKKIKNSDDTLEINKINKDIESYLGNIRDV